MYLIIFHTFNIDHHLDQRENRKRKLSEVQDSPVSARMSHYLAEDTNIAVPQERNRFSERLDPE